MLSDLDLHQSISHAEFKRRCEPLQWRLYALQQTLFQKKTPVVVVLEGWAAAGKGAVISVLAAQLDPRGMRVVPIQPAEPFEQRYPWLHRFWLNAPAAGQIVIFDSSWYRRVLIERLLGLATRSEWQAAYQDIRDFEQTLADDGTVLLKFWLHISKKTQRRRFEALLDDKLTRWQVDEEDQAQHAAYRRYYKMASAALERTHTPQAPWILVEATHKPYAQLKVLETVVDTLEKRLGVEAPAPSADLEAPSAQDIVENPAAEAPATADAVEEADPNAASADAAVEEADHA